MADAGDSAPLLDRAESAEPAPGDVFEEDALDRLLGAETEDIVGRGTFEDPSHHDIVGGRSATAAQAACAAGPSNRDRGYRARMPIHLRAEPADYAEACLLPGDPLRAKWIAERFLEAVREVNAHRGLLGFTGTFEGRPVSVQGTGMGCPSLAIVVEELVQLGVKRLLRVGTCGALSPRLALGDLVLALSSVPADGTTAGYLGGEPHVPTADWELLHGAVHAAKETGRKVRVGPIASTDVFYEPDPERNRRWAERGILAVEMEASALFTIAALRGVQAGCLLVVSDTIDGEHTSRIGDAELAASVEAMAELALRAATSARH